MMFRIERGVGFVCVVALGISVIVLGAATEARAQASEESLKAAVVFNFAKLTEWGGKAAAATNITVCTMGLKDSFAKAFEGLEGKPAQNKTIKVKSVAKADEFASCQIVFLSEDAAKKTPEATKMPAGHQVVTISDREGFAEAGGVAGLVLGGGRVQIEVNSEAATHAGVKLGSMLLRVAKVVK